MEPSRPWKALRWGNLRLFDESPLGGDGSRWERLFESEFENVRGVQHRTFAWDRVDGSVGSAREEFAPRGYELEETVGLVATPDRVRSHPREIGEVVVRALESLPDAEEELWEQVMELQVAPRNERFEEETHRTFCRRRLRDPPGSLRCWTRSLVCRDRRRGRRGSRQLRRRGHGRPRPLPVCRYRGRIPPAGDLLTACSRGRAPHRRATWRAALRDRRRPRLPRARSL
jgi:hypothetical protein